MANTVIVKLQKISLSKPNVKLPLDMIWFQLHDIQFIQQSLKGYKWSTRVNDKLLQEDISEDHASS